MDVREKLAGLLNEAGDNVFIVANQPVEFQKKRIYDEIADYLIAHGVTVQKWIPVTERLPEEWTNVLVYSGCNYDVLMYRPNRKSTLCFMYQDKCGHWTEKHSPPVTHWMPLPQPPKGE